MLKNIEYIEINRKKVMQSTFFVPLAAPFFLIFLTIFRDGTIDNIMMSEVIGALFLALIYGVIFWLPTILGILLIEFIGINKSTNETGVGIIFLIEAILAFVIIWALFGFSFRLDLELPFALALSIIIPQLFRWFYLKRKNRMLNAAPSDILTEV